LRHGVVYEKWNLVELETAGKVRVERTNNEIRIIMTTAEEEGDCSLGHAMMQH